MNREVEREYRKWLQHLEGLTLEQLQSLRELERKRKDDLERAHMQTVEYIAQGIMDVTRHINARLRRERGYPFAKSPQPKDQA